MKVSPVIEYFPVSPVAPPNKTTFYLLTIVIVCPNLAWGISPLTSRASTTVAMSTYWTTDWRGPSFLAAVWSGSTELAPPSAMTASAAGALPPGLC